MRIDRDRLLEQSQSLENPLFRYWIEDRKRAQVEIVGAEVGRRPRGGAAHLGGLQCRLDDAGDADRDLVLQARRRLRASRRSGRPRDACRSAASISCAGDAHPAAGLAHRAFEHIAHAELAPDLLHVDRAGPCR